MLSALVLAGGFLQICLVSLVFVTYMTVNHIVIYLDIVVAAQPQYEMQT